MKKPYRLKTTIGETYKVDLEDIWATKQNLKTQGFYKEPDHGMTPYPDRDLFDAIRDFQSAKDLRVDGIMKPDGETEREVLKGADLASMTKRRHCPAIYGGVYHPFVCSACYSKGYR